MSLAPPRRALWLSLGLALIFFRAYVFIFYPHAYFDSDQAILGLMTKHLIEGRTLPIYFYGQRYLMPISPWLAVPFFWALGPTVAAVKWPLLLINGAVWILFFLVAEREMALRPWQIFMAGIFFLAPALVTASRLVEAQGANVEPFLFVILLWMWRRRPLLFGATFAAAFLNRPFVLYALVAMILIDTLSGELRRGEIKRKYLLSLLSFAPVYFALTRLAMAFEPESFGRRSPGPITKHAARFWADLKWCFTRTLPDLGGWRTQPLAAFGISSSGEAGHAFLWLPVVIATVIVMTTLYRGPWRKWVNENNAFGTYLTLTGAMAVIVFACFSAVVRDIMLVRYILLGLCFPMGLSLLFFSAPPRPPSVKFVFVGALACLAFAATWDTARLGAEYFARPPRDRDEALVTDLSSRSIKFGHADYWVAYKTSFLTGEKIILSPYLDPRIPRYEELIRAADPREKFDVPAVTCSEAGGPDPYRCPSPR